MKPLNSLIVFFTFVLSLGLTYLVRQFALSKNIIDTPNERSSHTIPTPRGGGLAIVLSFYLSLVVIFALGELKPDIFYGILGLASIAIIGFIDDHDHIPARYRLIVHFAAAGWACYWLGIIPWGAESDFLFYVLIGITLFYLVWLLNLYNFMDGIDGIATVEALSVLFGVTVILFLSGHQGNLLLLMIFMAALCGFLIWNWPPAKIFMGDVGSAFIGILIGALSLVTANDGSLNFFIWLILLAVFITDATYTLLVRLIRGEKVYEAHRSHAYQFLSRQYGHKAVTSGVLAINLLWLLPLAWLGFQFEQYIILLLGLAYAPLIIVARKSRAGLAE